MNILTILLAIAVVVLVLRVRSLEKRIEYHETRNLPGDWPTAKGYWDAEDAGR